MKFSINREIVIKVYLQYIGNEEITQFEFQNKWPEVAATRYGDRVVITERTENEAIHKIS